MKKNKIKANGFKKTIGEKVIINAAKSDNKKSFWILQNNILRPEKTEIKLNCDPL